MRVGHRPIFFLCNAILAGLAAGQAAPVSTPGSLLGTWEAVARSNGGLGSTLSFGADNSLTFSVGALVDMKYRRAGDSLFVTDQAGTTKPSQIKIIADTLVETKPKGVQKKMRVGAAPARGDSLLGVWTYPHYTGVAAFEEYTADGQLHLRVPVRTLKGNYVTAGETAMMHLMGDGGGDREVKFAVSADTLQLTWNGQTSRYVKASPVAR
jgi:hypothetical protein